MIINNLNNSFTIQNLVCVTSFFEPFLDERCSIAKNQAFYSSNWLIKILAMQLKIALFGITKDIIGGSSLVFEINETQTVEKLRNSLFQQYPALQHLNSLAIAVNGTYALETQIIQANDEVVLIPPVSGG